MISSPYTSKNCADAHVFDRDCNRAPRGRHNGSGVVRAEPSGRTDLLLPGGHSELDIFKAILQSLDWKIQGLTGLEAWHR